MTVRRYTLTISRPDRAGINAAVSGFIAQHGGFISSRRIITPTMKRNASSYVTCHYVSHKLDGGPIIEQNTVRIDQGDKVKEPVRYGSDIGNTVLTRSMRYHVEDPRAGVR